MELGVARRPCYPDRAEPAITIVNQATDLASRLGAEVERTVRGKPDVVRLALSALLSGGHLLLSDLPGTGKTLLAKSIAAAIGGRFGRVQCTPDLLPTDVSGTSIFQPVAGHWEFREGPVFSNVLLVDEVNRASPRTQAALLEPMEERQVTVDGVTRALPDPFFCIATMNPLGQAGTFPLPESQLDRFALVLSMGLPGRDAEREILTGRGGASLLSTIDAVTSPAELARAIAAIHELHCDPAVIEYLLELTEATRRHPELTLGASPRASVRLLAVARAHAAVCGRHYVTPDDVQATVVSAYLHRVSVGGRVDMAVAHRVLSEIVAATPVPRG